MANSTWVHCYLGVSKCCLFGNTPSEPNPSATLAIPQKARWPNSSAIMAASAWHRKTPTPERQQCAVNITSARGKQWTGCGQDVDMDGRMRLGFAQAMDSMIGCAQGVHRMQDVNKMGRHQNCDQEPHRKLSRNSSCIAELRNRRPQMHHGHYINRRNIAHKMAPGGEGGK